MRTLTRVDILAALIDDVAHECDFTGVVRVDRPDFPPLACAFGVADRQHAIPMRTDTILGTASGAKSFTALAIMSLVEQGVLTLDTTARSLLGSDLPLIPDDVTVGHLLAHRSGIGDYLDEEAGIDLNDYLMPAPVQYLADTEQYLPILAGHPPKFAAGAGFAYCNGGFIVLALIAERASGIALHDLLAERVLRPAGLVDTGYLRSDALPARAGLGYLQIDGEWRSNVFHLPVRGNGDGGIFTTVHDIRRLWTALFAGHVVSPDTWALMRTPTTAHTGHGRRYGLGFWLHESTDSVILEGCDAGVSFAGRHDPHTDTTFTIISPTTHGAWPLKAALDQALYAG